MEMEAIFNRCWVLKGHGDKGLGDRYIGSLFRVDEPVPDDSVNTLQTKQKSC